MGELVLMPLRQPPPERLAEIWAASDEAWPGYLARIEAREAEERERAHGFARPLRVVK